MQTFKVGDEVQAMVGWDDEKVLSSTAKINYIYFATNYYGLNNGMAVHAKNLRLAKPIKTSNKIRINFNV